MKRIIRTLQSPWGGGVSTEYHPDTAKIPSHPVINNQWSLSHKLRFSTVMILDDSFKYHSLKVTNIFAFKIK